MLREIIFARMLGADAVTDQYVAAFRIPDFLNYLLAGAFLSITFIPIFARYLAADDEEGGWRAFAAVLRPIGIGITVLVAVGMAVAPWVIGTIYPDFTAAQVETTTLLTRIVLPAQIFFVLGALFTAVQYTKGSFVIPTLAPVIYNLGIITGGVGYAVATGEPHPEGFIWGALAGAFVGNFLLQIWGARRVGMRLPAGTAWGHPAIREYLVIALPLMIGQSIVVLDETFMSVFGDLVGDGVQSELLYARRTMFVPVGIIAQAAGVAAYPYLARLFAEGRLHDMAATVRQALRYVVIASLAAAALLAALSTPTIRVLFEGSAFTPEDTTGSASALFFYAFSIPIWGTLQVITRGFYARREMWVPVIVGTGSTLAAIPIYFGLSAAFDIQGVALASVLSLGLYTGVLSWEWYRRTGSGELAPLLDSVTRAVPLAVVGGIAAWGAAWLVGTAIDPAGFIGSLAALVAGTAAFAGVVLAGGSTLHDLEARRGVRL